MVWLNAVVQGILVGGLYALFATGLSLVFGVMRLVNLAHGDLAILAAYIAVVLADHAGLSPWLSLLVVVPVMAAGGFVLQFAALNFTLDSGLAPLLATFGLAIIIQNALQEGFTANVHGLDAGAIGTDSIRVASQISVGWLPLLTFAVAVLLLGGLKLVLRFTSLGRALRATSDDQRAAQLVGIDNRRLYAIAMAISLGTAAVAGIFLGMRTTFDPYAGPVRLIFAFEAVIIGGLGSLWGTLLGGIVLGVAQGVGDQVNPGWGVLAGHLVFLAVLLVRPTGLFGKGVTA
ncbi:MAG: branched-chain amino acid ABC transporter permease [Gaiellaceae bacterium]